MLDYQGPYYAYCTYFLKANLKYCQTYTAPNNTTCCG